MLEKFTDEEINGLINECRKKYEKLSKETIMKALTGEIGTNSAMIEQGQAERKAEKLEKEMSCVSETIKKELIRRKVHFEPWFSATQLTNLLIDSINQ